MASCFEMKLTRARSHEAGAYPRAAQIFHDLASAPPPLISLGPVLGGPGFREFRFSESGVGTSIQTAPAFMGLLCRALGHDPFRPATLRYHRISPRRRLRPFPGQWWERRRR